MNKDSIKSNVEKIRKELPARVLLVAASKTRSPEEVKTAILSGIRVIGYNYVQEAEGMRELLKEWEKNEAPHEVRWHLIGHLQRNKAKKAVELFDMIETIDSVRIAEEVDKRCRRIGKIMPVLIEVNSGRESNKTGVLPDDALDLAEEAAQMKNLKIQGLMTMGPRFGAPEAARPYFKLARRLFDRIKSENIPNVEMKYLSMGMSNTYRQAVEEGAHIVRIGTKLFGMRDEH